VDHSGLVRKSQPLVRPRYVHPCRNGIQIWPTIAKFKISESRASSDLRRRSSARTREGKSYNLQETVKDVSREARGTACICSRRGAPIPPNVSFSVFRLTVRSVLPSLSASVSSFSSSLLLRSFRWCTLLLSKARGAGYAHVPGTIDGLTATDASSSSRPVSPLPPLIFPPSPAARFGLAASVCSNLQFSNRYAQEFSAVFRIDLWRNFRYDR
jgi:hypothetical protein